MVGLTLVGDTAELRRARMFRLAYDLRRELGGPSTWQWCWHVEPNPRGTGHHVHAVQWGAFVSQRRLSELADKNGLGFRVDIRRVRSVQDSAMYGVKLAALASAAYSVKGAGEDLETFLHANGGRMAHASRGFWRDGRSGGALPGIRVAKRVAGQRIAGDEGRCEATGERHAWSGAWLP